MTADEERFAIVKTRFSKGDILFEATIKVFETESDAQAYLDEYLKTVDHGFRWSDWDEYEVRKLESG